MFRWLALICLLPCPALAARLAVLELRNASPLPAAEVRYLTERVRAVAQARASDDLMLMTRANLLALLPPGMDLADCEGQCEVETGRLIGADYVVGGEVVPLGSALRVVLTLHTTAEGRQLAAVHAGGAQVLDLEQDLVRAADRLFDSVPGLRPGAVVRAAPPPAPPVAPPTEHVRRTGLMRVSAQATTGEACAGPVRVGGQLRGPVPWQAPLAEGRYEIEVDCGHRTARRTIDWAGEAGEVALEAETAGIQLGLSLLGAGGWQLGYTGWFDDRRPGAMRVGLALHGGRHALQNVDPGYEQGAWHAGMQLRLGLALSERWDWTLDFAADLAGSGCRENAAESSDCRLKEAADTFDLYPLLGGASGVRYAVGPLAFDLSVWLLKPFMYRGPAVSVVPSVGGAVEF